MSRFSMPRQALLLSLTLGLWAFVVYIRFIASPATLLFIGASQFDKIAHIAGGMFIGALVEWRIRRARTSHLAVAVLAAAVIWETLEYLFDADVSFFYNNAFNLWLLDSLGDIVAAALGGYGYWVFFKKSRA